MRDIKPNSIEVRATVPFLHPSTDPTQIAVNGALESRMGGGTHIEDIQDKPYFETPDLAGITEKMLNKKRIRGVRI